MNFEKKDKVLVVAAHPDDDVLGCGGTIAFLRNKGINVLGVCPGYTKTNFNKRAHMSSVPVAGYLMSSQEVVDQSLKAYNSGKFLIINGKINKFARFITSLFPKSLSLKMSKSIIKKGMSKKQW